MSMTRAEKRHRWKEGRRARGLSTRSGSRGSRGSKETRHRQEHERRKRRTADNPFIGVDSEGAGKDEHGRQLYWLFRIGERELYTGEPLTTLQIAEFLLASPKRGIMVGFGFGYDVTMILRDLNPEQVASAFAPKLIEGRSRYTEFGDIGIDYLPRNYFRVCRLRTVKQPGKKTRKVPIAGTARTVYDTFGFFQCSFVRALADWNIGTAEERERIAVSKANRDDAAWTIGETERAYCALECDLLGQLMENFRSVCFEAGIHPRSWNGAGKIASALHSIHDTMTAKALKEAGLGAVIAYAQSAYYGGRFEITRSGDVGAAHEYDLKSAYPAMMRTLPCLTHGTWKAVDHTWFKTAPSDALYVATVNFDHPIEKDHPRRSICGLPIRKKDMRLYWPRQGAGVYWSVEINAARRIGCRVIPQSGWLYERRCDCQPFDWVERLYKQRQALGNDGRGKVLKLGLNSLYGKLAQRIGSPKYANMIWAGLITAGTRAALLDAAVEDPDGVIMFATDALFTRRPLALPIGEDLGCWEHKAHERLFIVQPGIYWGPVKAGSPIVKTRGVGAKFFEGRTHLFENAWRAYAGACQRGMTRFDDHPIRASDFSHFAAPPIVTLEIRLFIGLKLAYAQNKPLSGGAWITRDQHFRFDWQHKRSSHVWETDTCVWHVPCDGSRGQKGMSLPHKGDEGLLDLLDLEKAMYEDQPDYLDFSASI